ncbi:MAG TPA: VOC family protein [Chloroflexota bacterium]|nr:VOC family protein [Chloroflexota bacterium]
MQPAARADPSVLAVYHTGVTVSSLERSLQFYRDLLGLEVVGTRTAREPYIQRLVDAPGATLEIALLRVPGSPHFLELLEYVDVERAPAQARPRDPGAGHLCFFVRDLAGLCARLQAAGFVLLSEPQTATAGRNAGASIVYVRDPDSFWVELMEDPNYV